MMHLNFEDLLAQMRESADEDRKLALRKANEEIEKEYLANLNAIDRLKSLAARAANQKPSAPSEPLAQSKTILRDKTGPIAATREAIKNLNDGFTARDVVSHIRKNHPNAKIAEASIFSAINKLKTSKDIEVLDKREGRGPGTYRKIGNESAKEDFSIQREAS